MDNNDHPCASQAGAGAADHPPGAATIATLGELIRFVAESTMVPEAQKPYLRSALNSAKALVGDGRSDIPLEPEIILRRLARISPAMAGLTPQSFANLKSRVRAAFRLAAPHLAPARSRTGLEGEWQVLAARLSMREQRRLSRLMRFAQDMGWQPSGIGEEQVERFQAYLEHEAVVVQARAVVQTTRRAWNRAADSVPGWPQRRLEPPQSRRRPYWLRPEQLPSSLRQEIADYLHRRAHPDPFLGTPGNGLAASTIAHYGQLFTTVASALVRLGVPVEELGSIARLVQPDHLERALRFLHDRAGGRVTEQMHQFAYRARQIAKDVGLPAADLTRLDHIVAAVRDARSGAQALTEKNRRLLDHVDDPAFVGRLLAFPQGLAKAAGMARSRQHAASLARDAVAVELLLTCSMRVGNLVTLRLGETIRRIGQGRHTRWVIDIPGDKVKNGQPLHFTLMRESVPLLEWYLASWHHAWCGAGSPWLFPARNGGHVAGAILGVRISQRARRHVGVAITCHQFRHLAAELYLRQDPAGIGIVSQHLGHRKLDTTRQFYARPQSRIATQRYQEVLMRQRAKASPARSRRPAEPEDEAL